MTGLRASIVIPTLDGGALFEHALRACARQDYPEGFEILVIDSASTDGTPEIARHVQGVRVHEIERASFSHSGTRNLGAAMTTGDAIVYLTQDAVPTSTDWLAELLRPLALSPNVGLAYGRQIPNPTCHITVKRDVSSFFESLADDSSTRIVVPTRGVKCGARARFFSNVNSAIRRSLWEASPFPDVPYAEDLALAQLALDAGWWKAYVPTAAVLHSHDLKLAPYYRRMFDEFRAVRNVSGGELEHRVVRHAAAAAVGTARDVAAALRDGSYAPSHRLRGVLTAPAYNIARRIAIWRASR